MDYGVARCNHDNRFAALVALYGLLTWKDGLPPIRFVPCTERQKVA